MCKDIQIKEERISSIEYIEFLKRTDLGSQYPKERFEERMAKLIMYQSVLLQETRIIKLSAPYLD